MEPIVEFVRDPMRFAELASSARVVDPTTEVAEEMFRTFLPHLDLFAPEAEPTRRAWLEADWTSYEQRLQWVYFPWRNTLVRLPDEELLMRLRTSRNRFLIEDHEQDAFYEARIGIAGLSVGSAVLGAITLTGGGKYVRLAELDHLALTNLNRLQGSVCDLGVHKIDIAIKHVLELNPYAHVNGVREGLTPENVVRFLSVPDKLDVFIEEMDDIQMKVMSRAEARALKIPVVMATDNGDNTIIDVERFDLELDRPLFHGRADEALLATAQSRMTMPQKVKLAQAIVGPDITSRMQASLMQVGQTIPTWPQLGTAAILSGAATAYVVRRIVTGLAMPSGRYRVCLDERLDAQFHDSDASDERERLTGEFVRSTELVFV